MPQILSSFNATSVLYLGSFKIDIKRDSISAPAVSYPSSHMSAARSAASLNLPSRILRLISIPHPASSSQQLPATRSLPLLSSAATVAPKSSLQIRRQSAGPYGRRSRDLLALHRVRRSR